MRCLRARLERAICPGGLQLSFTSILFYLFLYSATESHRSCEEIVIFELLLQASQVVQVVKNLPANAGDAGDIGSIPGLGRSREEERAAYFSILTWDIPWKEEPGGLQSMGSKRIEHN